MFMLWFETMGKYRRTTQPRLHKSAFTVVGSVVLRPSSGAEYRVVPNTLLLEEVLKAGENDCYHTDTGSMKLS